MAITIAMQTSTATIAIPIIRLGLSGLSVSNTDSSDRPISCWLSSKYEI